MIPIWLVEKWLCYMSCLVWARAVVSGHVASACGQCMWPLHVDDVQGPMLPHYRPASKDLL